MISDSTRGKSRSKDHVAETVATLEANVNKKLTESNVKGIVSDLLKFQTGNGADVDAESEAEIQIRRLIEEKGILDLLYEDIAGTHPDATLADKIKDIKLEPIQLTSIATTEGLETTGGKRYLSLTVLGGRAFLSTMDINEDASHELTMHVRFGEHRYTSKPVMSSTEPAFREEWLLPIPADPFDVLQTRTPIHFVVTRRDLYTNRVDLVGTVTLSDWHKELIVNKPSKVTRLEIKKMEVNSVTTGLIDMEIKSVPRFADEQAWMEEVGFQLQKRTHQKNEVERVFLTYSKIWWRDYLAIRPSHSKRLVKLFVMSESGEIEFVSNYVYPLCTRYIESPSHAARFVSLLGKESPSNVGFAQLDLWQNVHTTLVLGKGTPQDLAVLLCNLLLGFSMNAYVAFGLDKNNAHHVWVATFDYKGGFVFWEPLTGKRYLNPHVSTAKHHFRTIDVLFNGTEFLANIQGSNFVKDCSYDLDDERLWKPVSRPAILSVRPNQGTKVANDYSNALTGNISFLPPAMNGYELATDMETQLRSFIAAYREDHGLATTWDSTLPHIFSMCISSYEHHHLTGTHHGYTDFEDSIKRTLPDGHVLKAFPTHVPHADPRRVFAALTKDKTSREILLMNGVDKARFTVRCSVAPYPENRVVSWVVLGVQFRPIVRVASGNERTMKK